MELPRGGGGVMVEMSLYFSITTLHASSNLSTPPPTHSFTYRSTFPSHDTGGLPQPNAFNTVHYFDTNSLLTYLQVFISHVIDSSVYFTSPISPLHSLCLLLSHPFQTLAELWPGATVSYPLISSPAVARVISVNSSGSTLHMVVMLPWTEPRNLQMDQKL